MKYPEVPDNEEARLRRLLEYDILDTTPEDAFDALTRAAAEILSVPIALVSLVDRDRQWFKSNLGLDVPQTPRDISFCAHVVSDGASLLVPDTLEDARFADNPLVTGGPKVRFYMGVPLRTADGFVLGTLCALDTRPREVTERQWGLMELFARQVVDKLELRHLNHELTYGQNRLRTLLDGMTEGAIEVGLDGDVVQSNRAAREILGLSAAQIGGTEPVPDGWRTITASGAPLRRSEFPAWEVVRTGARRTEVIIGVVGPSGTTTWICVNAAPLRGPRNGTIVGAVATFRDVTHRLEADARLQEERAFQRATLDLLPNQSLVVFDDDLRVIRHYGQPLLGLGAVAVNTLLPGCLPEDCRVAVSDAARGALAGEVRRISLARDLQRYEMTCVSFQPGPDAQRRGLALLYDVSERELLRERATRQDRLATTGTLAAGIGHEINNPLTYVAGNIEFAMEELREIAGGSPSGRLVELITVLGEARDGAERIRKIVRGLRAFASHEGAIVPTDVRVALEMSLSMAMHEIRQRASVTLALAEIPLAMGDETRVSQVFVNIIVNAGQAFLTRDPGHNRITVETGIAPDGRVAVHISDNGPGIPENLLSRVFDPFFTTKPSSVGTGLGLSISQGIIRDLGGEIICQSKVGVGTRFTILFQPVGSDLVPYGDTPANHQERGGRVLVVDDDASLLNTIARFLDRDHVVVAVSDPREALALITGGERYSLVLCDLAMPDMTGMELFERVQAMSHAQAERFVFMTGGSTDPSIQRFLDSCPNERLEKPFQVQNLRGVARRMVQPT